MIEQENILIVGGGPVGLSVALDLAWRGTKSLLIDRFDGTVDHPRAGGMSVRTMEHCRRWGVADEVRESGFNADFPLNQRFCTSVDGFELATARYPSLAEAPLSDKSPEKMWRCRQMWFDPILSNAAQRSGAELRYCTELVNFEQSDEGVICTLREVESDKTYQVSTRYLVACDGGRSTIREKLGIEMDGEFLGRSLSILFKADLRSAGGGELAERFIIMTPDGPFGTITSMNGHDLWRLIVREDQEGDVDPMVHVRKAIGQADCEVEVLSIMPWRRSQMLAKSYRHGNVFLAGDSAHLMVPTGGFGANTGIGDGVDLAWKLDATIKGWGGTNLLDSYEVERRPIAARNMAAALVNYKSWNPGQELAFVCEGSSRGETARRMIGHELVKATRAEWESTGVALGYDYSGSPLCIEDGTPPLPDDPADYVASARPGRRAPHAWLEDGRSSLDLFGDGYVLLRFKESEQDELVLQEAAKKGVPLKMHDIRDPRMSALYESRLVLVRPDGHVAWRGEEVKHPAYVLDVVTGA
ncbi:FAD-dependent monooxygenase [Henriciella sp.]|uniref:FAD-dependent monooxygenase n=1 Tax=Henriciella sp. TaxID=1968823 RepID=UPI00260490E1|nr:FAD-dependent monooxygenase [Henriciella sp.]